MSGRTMLAIRHRVDGTVVGVAEFLESNPDDERPWLGLLIIRGDQQRQRYGSEALRALLEYGAQARGWPVVRIAVNASDQRAMRFWQQHGFHPYRRLMRRLAGGEMPTACMERDLRA
jgi:RimJ/RimL family protein N-acetyltransferase